jgi:hypothetical protein
MEEKDNLRRFPSRRSPRSRAFRGWTAIFCVALTGISAAALGAPSIFDDDWKPPPDEPATAAPRLPPHVEPKPEPVKPEPVKPPPGPVNPATPAPAPPAMPARFAVPGAAAVATAEKLVKETFKAEYAQKTAAEQIAFARTLLSEAQQSRSDPPTLYVLLREARDLASAGGEPEVALEAARGMRDCFQLDARAAREMEHSTLSTAIRAMCGAPVAVATYEVSHRASDQALELAELDLAQGDYPGAAQISAAADQAARKTADWEYPARVHGRVTWLQAVDAEFELDRGLIASLKTNPADPAANLAAGRFDFVYLDRPDLGLPLLAKGSDFSLKALAARDLAATGPASTPALLTAAADAWADTAKAEPAPMKDTMQRRALALYDLAIPNEQGIEQAVVQKREETLRLSRVQKGVTAEFFRGVKLESRAFIRTDTFIAYDWTSVVPEINVPREWFSARWTGYIKAAPGAYKLMVIHDDGARVWIDGQPVVDQWEVGARRDTVTVQLTGQLQSLKVEYNQHGDGANMGLGWTAPGATRPRAVPLSSLFHEPIPPGPVIQPYVGPGPDGSIQLTAGAATIHSPRMTYLDDGDRATHLQGWEQLTDWVAWDFSAREGDYFVDVNYACDSHNAGSEYALSVGMIRFNGAVSDSGGWTNYDTARVGRIHLSPGLQSLRIKATSKPHQIVMDLHAVTLTPVKAGE